MGNTKYNKLLIAKLGILVVSIITYTIIALVYKCSIWLAVSNITFVISMLLYSKFSILGILFMIISNMCSNIGIYESGTEVSITGTSLVLMFGLIVAIAYKFIKDESNDTAIKKLINILKSENRPIVTKTWTKLIILSILLSISVSACRDMNITLLTSLWVMCPLFSDIAIAARIEDGYILKLLSQVVLMYILYMQHVLGGLDYINLVSVILVTVSILLGIFEIQLEKRKKKQNNE